MSDSCNELLVRIQAIPEVHRATVMKKYFLSQFKVHFVNLIVNYLKKIVIVLR